ncbi:hypothetical protein, partial [Ruminococcus sp.]|uniref:hypothetical protein n=1 Tax=Ruminococcus sp. TaxID=41978 RepID=UPI003865AB77
GKLWFNTGREILIELAQTLYSNQKFSQPFSKVVGVGKAHKTFSLHKILIAKQQAVWLLEHNGDSLIIAIATQKAIILYYLLMKYFF